MAHDNHRNRNAIDMTHPDASPTHLPGTQHSLEQSFPHYPDRLQPENSRHHKQSASAVSFLQAAKSPTLAISSPSSRIYDASLEAERGPNPQDPGSQERHANSTRRIQHFVKPSF